MFGWDEAQNNYQQVQAAQGQSKNEASLGHEVLAGGASFMAMKMFEDHQREEGKPVEHQFAKELIAGFAGAEVDRFAETTGEDWVDKEKAKHEAKKKSEQLYDQHYGQMGGGQMDPREHPPHRHMRREFRDQQWAGDQQWQQQDQQYGRY